MNALAWAIPLFLVFMSLEYLVARRKKKDYFQLHNSVANISIGIAERLLDVFTAGLFYQFYRFLQAEYGLFQIKAGWLTWTLLFLGADLVWYWYHRLAHEINLFWAVHIVHHQSEDFNYTVSARITVLQAFLRAGFWSVLPLMGFPAEMITIILLIHGLYPFFVHTRVIPKLGWLEYILVTPSHHRVHHASNEKYLDKNYGDVLIIWDKLFGTFVAEAEEPVYGLTKPLKSHSFLWQHFHFFIELYYGARAEKGWVGKLKLILGRPAMLAPVFRDIAERRFLTRPTGAWIGRPLNRYVIWQIIGLLPLLFAFILLEAYIPVGSKVFITVFILLTLINCGAVMEQKRWIFYLEFVRLFNLGLMIYGWFPSALLLYYIVLILGISLAYASILRKRYLRLVYAR